MKISPEALNALEAHLADPGESVQAFIQSVAGMNTNEGWTSEDGSIRRLNIFRRSGGFVVLQEALWQSKDALSYRYDANLRRQPNVQVVKDGARSEASVLVNGSLLKDLVHDPRYPSVERAAVTVSGSSYMVELPGGSSLNGSGGDVARALDSCVEQLITRDPSTGSTPMEAIASVAADPEQYLEEMNSWQKIMTGLLSQSLL